MRSDWTLEIRLFEKNGSRSYYQAIDLPVTTFGERLAEDMSSGLAFAGMVTPFETALTVLRERQFRRESFIECANRLGVKLADHMEDAEGWHGQDRQDLIRKEKC